MVENKTDSCIDINEEFILNHKYELYKFVYTNTDNISYICKCLETNKYVCITKIKNLFENNEKTLKILKNLKLLMFLNPEFVEKIIEIYKPSKEDYNCLYVVTNYKQTNFKEIILSKSILTNEHFKFFLYLVLRGLAYLHSTGTFLLNLNPKNIRIDINEVIDFNGFLINKPDEFKYQSPELLLCNHDLNQKSDVWSAGCFLSELVLRKTLFEGENESEVIGNIIEVMGKRSSEDLDFIMDYKTRKQVESCEKISNTTFESIFNKFDNVGFDLLSKMLAFNPYRRISIKECLEHPYLQDLHDPSEVNFTNEFFEFQLEKIDEGILRNVLNNLINTINNI